MDYTKYDSLYKAGEESIVFDRVTSIQIPEGNVVSIEDASGNTLWANINKLAYGVRWNTVTQNTYKCERIGNLELHKTLPIQSRFKVCVHKGTKIQYYCHPEDSRFREDTTGFIKAVKGNTGFSSIVLPDSVHPISEMRNIEVGLTDDAFADNKYLWMWLKIVITKEDLVNETLICRIEHIDTTNKIAYLNDINAIEDTNLNTKTLKELVIDNTPEGCIIEFGASLNGYDGEVGVDTGGTFYQWSVDNEGNDNEVWQSLYKCVSYARKIPRHIVGISRATVIQKAFDSSWGWLAEQEVNTAVTIVNYSPNVAGQNRGSGDFGTNTYDKFLGQDNFRVAFNKGKANISLATIRAACQKTGGGQCLYKQIWEALTWAWIIEYASFHIQDTYNSNLTEEGYHQGGLGIGVSNVTSWLEYASHSSVPPIDYTLHLGNNTGVVKRKSRTFEYYGSANHYWNYYTIRGFTYTKSSDNKILNISSITTAYTDWNINSGTYVGGTVKYKIEGLTDGQTVIFKRKSGNLTILVDGTYDIEWGSDNYSHNITFGKVQEECNIIMTIIEAPAFVINMQQVQIDVPHYRGFNAFLYGDIYLNIDNMLSKYDTDKNKRIYYYTDDLSKLSDSIENKEHQVESSVVQSGFIKELVINKTGDFYPRVLQGVTQKGNDYHWDNTGTSIHACAWFAGGVADLGSSAGLVCSTAGNGVGVASSRFGFAKCTVLNE